MLKLSVDLDAILSGHQNPIYTVENGPQSNEIFTGGNDKGVVLWNLDRMTFDRILMPVESSVYALHYIEHINCIAIGERSGKITIFSFDKNEILSTLDSHTKPVFDLKSLKGKDELLAASEDGNVSIWCLKTFKKLHHLEISSQTVRTIAINPDETLISFGTKDAKVYIFNASDFSFNCLLKEHSMPVTSMCFSPDGKHFLSGGRDAKLNIYETSAFALVEQITAHMYSIYSIAFHPTLSVFATASRDKSIKLWDAKTFELIKTISFEKGYDAHKLSINKMIWNKNSDQLISVGDEKLAFIWNVKSQSA